MGYQKVKVRLAAKAAAWRHGNPSKQVKVIMVVGADGAVGTISYLASILRVAGHKVGIITSQFIEITGERVQGSDQADMSTDPNRIQALLAQMRRAGCSYVVLEAPSTLPPHQFVGVSIQGVIIRRCGDDYIGQVATSVNQSKVNALLARRPQFVVYNRDDPIAEHLEPLRGQEGVISFGTHRRAECQITQVRLHQSGSQVELLADHHIPLTLVTKQPGKQASYDMVAAAATAYLLHVSVPAIEEGCEALPPLGLHMQPIPVARPFKIFLDAALTPAGLAETLEFAKHLSKNRLVVVFGAPLSTPASWLPRLGELFAQFTDRLIVTDGEYTAGQSPKQIREHIWQGVAAAGGEAKAEEVADRQAAIEKAISIARRGDVVLIAATTVRPYRQLGSDHLPWSDLKVIEQLFKT